MFDEVLGVAVDDEQRRGRLFAILEGIGGLGLELGHMEDGVNLNRAGKSKREGHSRGLRNDQKGANLFLHKLASGPIHTNMVSMNIDMVANMKWRGFNAIPICKVGHGVLGVLHSIAQELVVFVKVDGEMSSV